MEKNKASVASSIRLFGALANASISAHVVGRCSTLNAGSTFSKKILHMYRICSRGGCFISSPPGDATVLLRINPDNAGGVRPLFAELSGVFIGASSSDDSSPSEG